MIKLDFFFLFQNYLFRHKLKKFIIINLGRMVIPLGPHLVYTS